MEYAWFNSYFPNIDPGTRTWLGFKTVLWILPPKILFTYFLLWGVDRGINRSRDIPWLVAATTVALAASIILYRVILVYYVVPVMLNNPWKEKGVFAMGRLLNGFVDISLVAACAVAMKFLRMSWQSRIREKKLLQEKLEAELKFLRSQTNPHFLFNTLNNIYALARKKSDDTADVVMKLSKLLRFMLYESRKERIPVSGEIRMIEDYLELEKIRYNERLTIRFEKDIDDSTQHIAPLLLLPFIENAFKHGASETRFDSFIHINVLLKEGLLKFCIENSKEENGDTTITDNIGLSNVRRQLELMYQEHTLEVDNQKDRFSVHLTINLNNDATISLPHY
ncbi:histidine kinase [Paraflavitalea sp. CAU 1676]|uniref:sensor histidine kinase n=1 Tax=Paraflavitalea sp. CAU 1676 TaxID=3032598 RepID=UPI0023DB8CC8|nr:histidine kinase [Paraflavitalea sp. CAU 1676]MDF2188919.1 histidine kinase [Paraflavitalea sp. CAU 1676]